MKTPKDKDTVRRLHAHAVTERRNLARKHLLNREPKLLRTLGDPADIVVENIRPELTILKSKANADVDLWRWASLHWSIPVSAGYGRRLRFLVRDANHGDALIGVIGLGDPVYALSARDSWIQWTPSDRRERLACVMDAFVLGAAPPYDALLGGKLVALLATSQEVQDIFREKYANRVTLIAQRDPQADLALITTISALGRSSIYNRLTAPTGQLAYIPVGWTAGSGDFHLSGELYGRLARFAQSVNPSGKTERHPNWTGHSFRNRREVVIRALDALGLPSRKLRLHGIRREIYAAPLAANALPFLRGDEPRLDRSTLSTDCLSNYWLQRWAISRAERIGFSEHPVPSWELWADA